jgi:hypothetical protein
MRPRIRPLLTYANVMSTIGVFAAFSGVAWAASLPKNSVGADQIKKDAVQASEVKQNAVAAPEIKAGAVGSSELLDGSLTAVEFAPGVQLKGDKGDKGDAGVVGQLTTQTEVSPNIPDGNMDVATADCPAGQRAIGGGARADSLDITAQLTTSRPAKSLADPNPPVDGESFTAWRAGAYNRPGEGNATIRVEVWVVCAPA